MNYEISKFLKLRLKLLPPKHFSQCTTGQAQHDCKTHPATSATAHRCHRDFLLTPVTLMSLYQCECHFDDINAIIQSFDNVNNVASAHWLNLYHRDVVAKAFVPQYARCSMHGQHFGSARQFKRLTIVLRRDENDPLSTTAAATLRCHRRLATKPQSHRGKQQAAAMC